SFSRDWSSDVCSSDLFKILQAVMQVNTYQKQRLLHKMEAFFDTLKGKTIGVWGLAFKPNTDDIREAPALELIDALLSAGAQVKEIGRASCRERGERTV